MTKLKNRKFVVTVQITAPPNVSLRDIRTGIQEQLDYFYTELGKITKVRVSPVSDEG